jgi:1,4-dihydroxy-2-naphthoate octaprenyltransferase
MARSTVRSDALLEDVEVYNHAVIAFVDENGYPVSAATNFKTNPDKGTIELDRPFVTSDPTVAPEVNVTFSHVHPQPGVGYDQRRYISVWGKVEAHNGTLELTPQRTHGWDEERMSFFELCERSVPTAHTYMRKLSAERGKDVKPTMSLGWLIFLATRVPFLTATIVPIMLGAVIARNDGFSSWWLTVLALVGGAAIHLGLNVTNDVADSTGSDEFNVNPTMYSGGSRVIQYGLVSRDAMKWTAVGLYAVGIAIGLFLAATQGWELIWVGVAGVFLSIFYTVPPFKLVHRGLGEASVALGFGPIMLLGSYFVVAQRFTLEAAWASIPVALLIMLVLYVNQIPDKPADEKAGKRTIVVRLGKSAIVTGYLLAVLAAFIAIPVGVIFFDMPVWTLLALLTAPIGLQVYKGLKDYYESPYELMNAMGKNIMLHFATGLLLIAGYVIAIVV